MSTNDSQSRYSLIGNIVHDLKTPVSAIKSYADLLSLGNPLSDRQEQFRTRILAAADSMTNLINDLLDIVWLEEGMELRKAPCNLRDAVRGEISVIEPLAATRNIQVSLAVDDALQLVSVDERRIRQVINNLLSNSVKYNRQGGQIFVTIRQQPDSVHVEFRDTGLGIPPQDLPHIFERFYRARRDESSDIEGSGLGLSIAKAIVEIHGGRIAVESILDEGSLFWFTLPSNHTQRGV